MTTRNKRIKVLDIAKWNKDRLEAEARIRELKTLVRTEDKPVMEWKKNTHNWELVNTGRKYRGANDSQSEEIIKLKAKLTDLYRLRAYLRGRQHQRLQASVSHLGKRVKPVTVEQEAAWARETMKSYQLVAYQAA